MSRTFAWGAASLYLSLGTLAYGQATGASTSRQLSAVHVPEAISRSVLVGHTNSSRLLHIAVSLQPGNTAALQNFADSVSNPNSPNYRHFITPTDVGERFGLPLSEVQAVGSYLESYGFKVKLLAKNRLSVLADGTVAQAEAAFHTTINDYQVSSLWQAMRVNEPGHTSYFAYSTPLSMPAGIAANVLDVSGLESYTKPQLRTLTPTQARVLYNLAPEYNAGYQGQGRNIAISNFDGYRLSNVPLYYSQYGLPTPSGGVGSNITVHTISGGAGSGTPQGEGDLDIQMVLGMAPLCNFHIYDTGSSDLISCLTQEANDNIADVISESYGWNLPAATATSAHNEHLSMTAEGITYMAATGDSGTTLEPYSYPDYEPEVLQVGGTVATVNSSGVRTSEVAWSSGGGGWSTNTATFNTRPSWQNATGVPTTNNHRLVPDIAINASATSGGAYYFYLNGSLSSGYVGTSFASPVFAGSLGVAEQRIIALGGLPANGSGKQRFGRINDLFYSQNMRSDVWFDITSGSNGTLPDGTTSSAHSGWDYCTGLGAINWDAFINTQASQTPPAAPTNLTASAGNAQVSLSWTASTGATSYTVYDSTTSGGPYTNIGSVSSNSANVTGLTNGTTYYFVVTASNSSGTSGNSNQASATPNVSIPPAPTGLSATAGNAQVSLAWSASSGATSYNVGRSTTSGGPYTTIASPTSTSYTDTGLTNGTTYYYVVSASNSAGTSANSSQVSATPTQAQAQQLMLNPGFESGTTNWTQTAGVIGQYNSSGEPAHSGTWDAWLDGYGTTHTDTLYQTVTIPSTITTATLSFWLHIDTAETTTTTAYDTLKIQIRNTSNTVLATLATYSNLNHNTGYTQKSFNVAAYKGQTIRVYLVGAEDSSLQTSFVVDDFALNVQ